MFKEFITDKKKTEGGFITGKFQTLHGEFHISYITLWLNAVSENIYYFTH